MCKQSYEQQDENHINYISSKIEEDYCSDSYNQSVESIFNEIEDNEEVDHIFCCETK